MLVFIKIFFLNFFNHVRMDQLAVVLATLVWCYVEGRIHKDQLLAHLLLISSFGLNNFSFYFRISFFRLKNLLNPHCQNLNHCTNLHSGLDQNQLGVISSSIHLLRSAHNLHRLKTLNHCRTSEILTLQCSAYQRPQKNLIA